MALATLVAFGLATNLTLEPIDAPGYDWLVSEAAVTGTAHAVIDFLTQAGDPTPMALVGAAAMIAFTIGWADTTASSFRSSLAELSVGVGAPARHRVHRRSRLSALWGGDLPVWRQCPHSMRDRADRAPRRHALAMAVTRRRIGWYVAATLGALEGFTRLVLLIHWPTDVIAGWAAGAATAFAAILAVALWERRSPNELPPK